MKDTTFMRLMKLLPKSAVSTVVGALTRAPVPSQVHQVAMRAFALKYRVNVTEMEGSFDDYSNFGQFFTRRLKPGSRSVDAAYDALISPVDGAVSQSGDIVKGAIIQAKGIDYQVSQLLGNDAASKRFENGKFATLYLAPKDYHRIHAPLEGDIEGFNYIPGQFWPVNPSSVRLKQALFAINERLITWLKTRVGSVAVVAVGATCVSRIHAAYDNIVTHRGEPARSRKYDTLLHVEKADELGMFEMGSTVVLLFEPHAVEFSDALKEGTSLRFGQRIGTLLK